jgi:hypothetical protein
LQGFEEGQNPALLHRELVVVEVELVSKAQAPDLEQVGKGQMPQPVGGLGGDEGRIVWGLWGGGTAIYLPWPSSEEA